MKHTWLNMWGQIISFSEMVRNFSGGAMGSIFPTWTLRNDLFGKMTQLRISNPVNNSPLVPKETCSPAPLLKESCLKKWWSWMKKKIIRIPWMAQVNLLFSVWPMLNEQSNLHYLTTFQMRIPSQKEKSYRSYCCAQ